MISICIIRNLNGDTRHYDVIEPENSTLPVVPPQEIAYLLP